MQKLRTHNHIGISFLLIFFMLISFLAPTPAMAADEQKPKATIQSLSATLFYGADKQKDGTFVWNVPTNYNGYQAGHHFNYRISYSTSGEGMLDAGTVKLKVPAHVIYNREGKVSDTVEWSIPSREDVLHATDENGNIDSSQIDDDISFAYYPDGDYYTIYNFRQISAATNGYIDIGYATAENSFAYQDMKDLTFTCDMQVGKDDDADKKTMTADPVVARINTTAKIESTYKQYPSTGRIKTWDDSWGTAVKPADPTAYYYQVYNIKSNITATQPYDFSIADTVSGNYDGVVVLGYHFSGENGYKAENSVSNQNITGDRWDAVLVAIPLSAYSDKTHWEVKDNEVATVTPVDKVDAPTSKAASQYWDWSTPTFDTPTGHLYALKYGDRSDWYWYLDDKHEYTRYDLEEFDGFKTSSENTEPSLKEYSGFKYKSMIYGYPYPWTYDSSKVTDADQPWTAYGNKPVKFELIDQDIFLVNAETGLLSTNESEYRTIENGKLDSKKALKLTSDDYKISSISYDLSVRDAEYDSEETGEWKQKTATLTDNDTIVFWGKFGNSDTWVPFATYNPNGNKTAFDSTRVASMDNSNIVFKADQSFTSYRVTGATSHYYFEVNTYPSITLKNSDAVLNLLKNSDTKGRELAIVNNQQGNFYSLKDGVTYDGADYKALTENADNWSDLMTVETSATDYARAAAKYSSITKAVESTSNNVKQKEYVIGWKIHADNTTKADDKGTKQYIPQQSGIFFDLLPDGTILDKSTIQVKAGNTVLDEADYTVNTISDYQHMGRTMLVVSISKGGDYYDLRFETRYPWNSIKDYGKAVYNPVAYETGNDSITDGTADDGGSIKDAKAMSDLSKKCGITKDKETGSKFIYAENSYDISALTSAVSGLTKKVKTEEDSKYSKETMTHIGGNYSYELRFMNSYMSDSKNIILFDSLENYDTDTNTNNGVNSAWHGTLQSIDTQQLEKRGAAPVVYFSTQEHLNLDDHHDISDTSVWTKVDENTDLSTAKAVAIDVSKSADGSDFVLSKGDSVAAYLYMKAPAEAPDAKNGEKYPYAYNNVYVSDTVFDSDNAYDKGQDFYIYYNYTRIGLTVTGNVSLMKTDAKTGSFIKGIKFRLRGTSAYKNGVDITKQTNSNGKITFSDIEMGTYTLQEADATDDYLLDPTEHTVVIDRQGKTTIDDVDYTNDAITLTNSPRVHTDIKFIKADAVYNTTYLPGAKYRLSGQSAYGDNVLIMSESSAGDKYGNGKGLVTFENIPKSTSAGYQLQEVSAPGGYVLDPTVYKVTIDDSGNYRIDGKLKKNIRYSYTENLEEDGTQTSNYGNSWNNSNIRGSGRTAADSKAHVITIDGAQKLHVKLTWGGESASYDWVSIWQGGHPDYTAANNYSSGIKFNNNTAKGGGGNHTSASNTAEFDVDGDSVTFSFRSDGSGYGDGYGYYAVITQAEPTVDAETTEEKKTGNGTYVLMDEPLHYITLTKKSSYDGSIISGAKFSLKGTSDNGTAVDSTAISAKDTGTVRFGDLESGTYILSEVKAPDGYETDSQKYIVIIKEDGSYTISGLTSSNNIYDFYNQKKQDKTITVTKVWDDGNSHTAPGELAVTITTEAPQQSQRTYSITFDANGGTFGNTQADTNGNKLTYNAKNEVTSGSYAEPSPANAEDYLFGGWSTDKNASKADSSVNVSENDLNNSYLSKIKTNENVTLYAVYIKRPIINYAVSVYGIGQDVDENGKTMGLTFGPATGANYSKTYVSHTPTENTSGARSIDGKAHPHRCIHNDSWTTIIYWNQVDPDVYEQCMGDANTPSCTKAVPIKANNTLFAVDEITTWSNSGDGYGAIGYELKRNYRIWNPRHTSAKNNNGYDDGANTGGWPASRIRAMMNGTDSNTVLDVANGVDLIYRSDGVDCYRIEDISEITSSNCLLSCFPKELQQAIGAKTVKTKTAWSDYSDDYGSSSLKTTYDKLWLLSVYEMCPIPKKDFMYFGLKGEGVANAYSDSDSDHAGMYARNILREISADHSKATIYYAYESYAFESGTSVWLRSIGHGSDTLNLYWYSNKNGATMIPGERSWRDYFISPGFSLNR